jgi:hypothetical protein
LLDSVVRPGLTYVYNLALMWLELDEPREVPSELAELSRVLHAREVLPGAEPSAELFTRAIGCCVGEDNPDIAIAPAMPVFPARRWSEPDGPHSRCVSIGPVRREAT